MTVSPDFYKCLSGGDLLVEDKPLEYSVEGLFPKASVNLLLATSNVGKTMISCATMLAVASGTPLMGYFKAKSGNASLLDWESRLPFIRRRLQELARGMQLGPEVMDRIFIKTPVPFHATDKKYIEHMKRLCEGKDLVIMDSLAAMNPGVDENDKNVRNSLDSLRYVNDYTTFCVIHHTRKLPLNYEPKDSEELGRGSGAIKQAVDCEYTFVRNAAGVIKTYQTKNRLGPYMKPFCWRINSDWNGVHSNWIRLEYMS